MARMSIDDMVGRDPRVRLLAKSLGWSVRETVGCLVIDVWPICYDQMTHLISERVLDAAADREGFAEALIEAELAHRDRSGKVYVAGAKKRIEYLAAKQRAGHEGGVKSAESRRKTLKQTSSTSGSTPQARRNPPVPDSVPDSAPAPDLVLVPEYTASPPAREPEEPWWGNPTPKPEQPPKPRREPSGPHQTAIAAFDAYYRGEHGGAKPTWNPKNAKLMSQLVKAHGVEEVVRRIRILKTAPPKFPPAPWDMGVFSQHFDKLAAANHGRTETAVEVAYRIATEET